MIAFLNGKILSVGFTLVHTSWFCCVIEVDLKSLSFKIFFVLMLFVSLYFADMLADKG